MNEAIGDAEDNKFSDFSKKVKTSLEDKLRSNQKMKDTTDKIADMKRMKDTFTQITKTTEPVKVEPAEPVVTPEPAAADTE